MEVYEVKRNTRGYFDYNEIFGIVNVIMIFILYGLSIYCIVTYIKSIILKIFFSIIAFPICLEFEYHYIMKIVNPVVDFLIPKKWKRAEAERIASFKQQAKAERVTKSRAEAEANRIAKRTKRKINGR